MRILIIIFLVLLCHFGYSQKSRIGIIASGNLYFLEIHQPKYKDGFYKTSPLFESYSLGLTYERRLYKNLYIKPELSYIKSHANSSFSNYKQDTLRYANYAVINQISLPILLRVNLKKIYLLTGPSYSFIINKSNLIKNKFDSGFNLGFGVDLPDINPTLSIDLRYYRGFLNLNDIGYHQNYIQLGLSLILTTKK